MLIGWTISGLLIGLSLGLFDLVFALATKSPAPHDNKIKNGLMGERWAVFSEVPSFYSLN